MGASLSVAPALTLLGTSIVQSVRRRAPYWSVPAWRFAVMACGAALLVIPQLAIGRSALEQFAPLGWALAFGVGVRAAQGQDAATTVARSRIAVAAAVGLVVALVVAATGVASGGAATWIWLGMHENLWAARVAVLALALPLLARGRPWTWSWTLGAAGALVAGSRAALIGVGLGAVAGWLAGRPMPAAVIRGGVVGTLLAAVVLGLFPSVRSHVFDGVRGLVPSRSSVNLVPASEDLGRAPWVLEGVDVEPVGLDSDGYAITRVTKIDGALGSRPIAPVDLRAEQPYVLTAILVPDQDARPGIRIWAPATATAPSFVASVGVEGAVPALRDAPGISFDRASITADPDGGWRVRVRLVVHGDQERRVWIGPAPDLRNGTVGRSVRVSRLQVAAEGLADQGYVPTYAESESARTAGSRLEIFAIARRGIAEAPWFGHGVASFEAYQRAGRAGAFAFGHAHNLFLQVLFETGSIGLLGFVLMFGAMIWPGRRRRLRPEVTTLVVAVFAMNAIDFTFVSADITMTFAAALGLASVPDATSVAPAPDPT